MGGRFHRFISVPGQINLLVIVVFILNEGARGEHERFTAGFFPTDGAVPHRSAG